MTARETMVERVARALFERDPAWHPRWAWETAPEDAQWRFRQDARAAIEAAEIASVRKLAELKTLITPYVCAYAGKSDCVDNDGDSYQSKHAADLEKKLLAALAEERPEGRET